MGMIDNLRETGIVNQQVEALEIKTHNLDQEVQNLSGGNQQKVVLAKWLSTQQVIILDEHRASMSARRWKCTISCAASPKREPGS
jgi:ABC-type sugar transport system ATPase subunit